MGFLSNLFSNKSNFVINIPKDEKIYSFSEEILESAHVLIAGTTGSGKSTLLNTLLTDGLYLSKCYYLIDLRKTELFQYKGLPNVFEYVNEFSKCEKAIDDFLYQMNGRLKEVLRRKIKQYDGLDLYFVIDEYSDLTNFCTDKTTFKRIEEKILQIASQGRALKCHLIISTQRCTGDILSSKIKPYITTRIGMRTASAQESRNIIGISGLERLPRYGQIIMISPNHNGAVKVEHPAYTPEEIEERIKKFREANMG